MVKKFVDCKGEEKMNNEGEEGVKPFDTGLYLLVQSPKVPVEQIKLICTTRTFGDCPKRYSSVHRNVAKHCLWTGGNQGIGTGILETFSLFWHWYLMYPILTKC
jgi:hypothetical protein